MANFSTNGVRQFYVVLSKETTFNSTTPAGGCQIKTGDNSLWFLYQTPNGDNGNSGTVRTDIIPLDKLRSVIATNPKGRKLKRQVVALDPTINSGNPVVGQEYLLRFTFYNIGMGGPENQYIRNGGSYRVKTGDTVNDVLTALKTITDKNLATSPYPYVTTEIVGSTLVVKEVPQVWVRGKRQADQVNFQVQCVPITTSNYNTLPWGIVTDETATKGELMINGRVASDMEYFYLGERGDTFRGMGFPDNFEAKYLADPNKQYQFVDFDYYYEGAVEDVQKSAKHITIAVPATGGYTIAQLITDLTSAGLTVTDNTAANSILVTNAPVLSGTHAVALTATDALVTKDDMNVTVTGVAYTATGLPAGLSISSSTGVISGTPTTAGTGTYTITATGSGDWAGLVYTTASISYTIA